MPEIEKPLVSVIMPVYNSEAHLSEAIESILNQTYTDFEFLIFNDGSIDGSKAIISSYNDNRIKLFNFEKNEGYTVRLNQGLKAAKGKYVARMDSDDIALPGRFKTQVDFFDANAGVTLCGGYFEFIEPSLTSRTFNWVSEYDPDMVKINLLFDCAICHPTVMMRLDDLKREGFFYNEELEPSEDYDMWIRMADKFALANVPEVVLKYRINGNQVSNKFNDRQRANKAAFIKAQLLNLKITATDLDLRVHEYLFFTAAVPVYDYLPKMNAWINRLKLANSVTNVYNTTKFNQYLDDLYFANKQNFAKKVKQLSFKNNLIYRVKCLLKWKSLR